MGKITINVPKYITHVELSKKRRAKRYYKGDKLPKKYQGADYHFNRNKVLVDSEGTPIIKNSRTAGTPRMKKINGQEIYSGNMHVRERAKIVSEMKGFFADHVEKAFKKYGPIPDDEMPVKVSIEIHTIVGEGNWDLDNLWIYNKVIQDVIAECRFIPNDNINYVTNTGELQFVEIDDIEKRKIVIKIEKDKQNESKRQTKRKRKDVRRDFED